VAKTPAELHISVLLFEGVNAQDLVGPYEVVRHLPGARVSFVAPTPGPVRTEGGLTLIAEKGFDDVAPDVVIVPGGEGEQRLRGDPALQAWLNAAHASGAWVASVCTGALLLGAAGLLRGKRATTYWLAKDELARFGAEVVDERYVFDGKLVTSAGVSAGIDMALALAAQLHSAQVAQAIQLGIEYDPQPPFQTGSPVRAPAELVAGLRATSRFR
jgi:transcriptional regulator GlxA family with amidase domain